MVTQRTTGGVDDENQIRHPRGQRLDSLLQQCQQCVERLRGWDKLETLQARSETNSTAPRTDHFFKKNSNAKKYGKIRGKKTKINKALTTMLHDARSSTKTPGTALALPWSRLPLPTSGGLGEILRA